METEVNRNAFRLLRDWPDTATERYNAVSYLARCIQGCEPGRDERQRIHALLLVAPHKANPAAWAIASVVRRRYVPADWALAQAKREIESVEGDKQSETLTEAAQCVCGGLGGCS